MICAKFVPKDESLPDKVTCCLSWEEIKLLCNSTEMYAQIPVESDTYQFDAFGIALIVPRNGCIRSDDGLCLHLTVSREAMIHLKDNPELSINLDVLTFPVQVQLFARKTVQDCKDLLEELGATDRLYREFPLRRVGSDD